MKSRVKHLILTSYGWPALGFTNLFRFFKKWEPLEEKYGIIADFQATIFDAIITHAQDSLMIKGREGYRVTQKLIIC